MTPPSDFSLTIQYSSIMNYRNSKLRFEIVVWPEKNDEILIFGG